MIILKKDIEELRKYIIIIAIFLAISGLSNRFHSGITQKAKTTLMKGLKSAVFRNILEKDKEFFDKNSQANIAQAINNGPEDLTNIALEYIIKPLVEAFNILIILVISNLISSKLGTMMFLLIPSKAFFLYQTSTNKRELIFKHQKLRDKVRFVPYRIFQNINLIKTLSTEEKEIKQFIQILEESESFKNIIVYEPEAFQFIKDLLDKGAIILLAWIGGFGVLEDTLSPGGLITLSIYSYLLLKAIDSMQNKTKELIYLLARCQNLFDILQYEPEVKMNYNIQTIRQSEFQGKISLRDIWFSYPTHPERKVLKNINIDIESGECVAIIGPESSGKHTLINLLLRHYDPRGGEILIGQKNIKNFNLFWHRQNIDYIAQDITLFDDQTIEENITYGVEKFDSEELNRAIELSNLDFIYNKNRFSKGLTTKIESHLHQFSRSEKRSFAIAQSILRKGKIFILHENELDFEKDELKNIKKLIEETFSKEGRTVILVAKTVNSIKCKRVYMLDKGKITKEETSN